MMALRKPTVLLNNMKNIEDIWIKELFEMGIKSGENTALMTLPYILEY